MPVKGACCRLEAGTLRWRQAPNLLQPRYGAVCVTQGSGVVLRIGGWDANHNRLALVEALEPGAEAWQIRPPLSSGGPTGCGAAAQSDGSVLPYGGARPGQGPSARVERLEPATGVLMCTPLPPLLEARSGFASGALADGRVVLAGGYRGEPALSSAEVYDSAVGVSTALPPMSRARGEVRGAMLTDGHFAVIGGRDGGTYLSSCEALDLRSNTWHVLPNLSVGCDFHAAIAVGGAVVAAGGRTGVGQRIGRVEVLDGDGWREVHAAHMPAPASSKTLTATL